jgi:serine protease Do
MTAAAPLRAIFATPPGSPAAKAGIKAGDVVTSVNSSPLEHARDFAELTSMMAPGSSVYLTTLRNGKARSVTLTIGSIKCQLYCSTNSVCLPRPVL